MRLTAHLAALPVGTESMMVMPVIHSLTAHLAALPVGTGRTDAHLGEQSDRTSGGPAGWHLFIGVGVQHMV